MIHVVLPAYNEEKTIGPLLDAFAAMRKEYPYKFRIIIVDDGSTDKTLAIITTKNKTVSLKVIRHRKNKGLNDSLRDGLIEALKSAEAQDIIITMDADNTHTPGLIVRMVRMVREGSDVVIASRYLTDSRVKGVPFHRLYLSWAARIIFTMLFPIQGVRDYTCGYRAYKASVLRQAFSYYGKEFINQPGFSCMVDILLKLRQFDVIITEAPLILRYDQKRSVSKMNIGKTIQESLILITKHLKISLRG